MCMHVCTDIQDMDDVDGKTKLAWKSNGIKTTESVACEVIGPIYEYKFTRNHNLIRREV
jgi:hypothetical protein